MIFRRQRHIERLLADTGLPASVAKVISDVVGRTRLWWGEKVDVAVELASHFQEGLDAGRTPDELIAAFGDTAQAARLIRRARKRQRSLPWRIARRGVQVAAALFVVYLLGIAYFLAGRPEPKVDYLAMLNAKSAAVPEHERAWPAYRTALVALGEPLMHDSPRPGEAAWSEVESYLHEHADVFADVRDAAARPGLGFVIGFELDEEDSVLWPDLGPSLQGGPLERSLYAILLPYLAEMRRLSRLLALDTHRAAAEGDIDTAIADVEAMLGIAGHARETPILINELVGNAIASLATDTTGELLATHPETLDDDQLRRLAHRLSVTESLFGVRFDSERYAWRDLVQRIYTDDGNGDGRLTPVGIRAMDSFVTVPAQDVPSNYERVGVVAGPLLLATVMSRREAVELHERLLSQYEAAGERPMWEWESGPGSEADNQIEMWMSSKLDTVRYYPLVLLMPALGRATTLKQYGLARRDAVLVAIALELDRRRRGTWAPRLDDLVPDLLPEIPPDRFDGRPLRYALVDGAPVLYSIGNDRDDDGGRRAGKDGLGRNDAAAQWFTDAGGPGVVDADWVLWPPARDAQ